MENTNLEKILLFTDRHYGLYVGCGSGHSYFSVSFWAGEESEVLDIPGCLILFVTDNLVLVTRVSPMSSNLWA